VSITPVGAVSVPEYRYFTASLLDGSVFMEVPFNGVKWERKISTAGSFSGSIVADISQDHFDLYNSTIPGKTALYVVRNGVCVWGGIIWSRDYDITKKTLSVTALEFTSYLYHRVYWKSMTITDGQTVKALLEQLITSAYTDQLSVDEPIAYSASDVYNLVTWYQKAASVATLQTEEEHGFAVGNVVRIKNVGTDYDGDAREITAVPSRFTFSFATTSGTTTNTATSASVGSYAVLKDTHELIQNSAAINMQYDIMTSIEDVDLSDFFIVGSGDNNPFTFRGGEMKYVGEILENFAKNGVPCYQDTPTKTIATTTTSSIVASPESTSVTLASVSDIPIGTFTLQIGSEKVTARYPSSVTPPSPTRVDLVARGIDGTTKTTHIIGSAVSGTVQEKRFISTRFDYFVECTYNPSTYSFTNTFRAWYIRKDVNTPKINPVDIPGLETLYGPSSLGASNFVFEHPGNISSFTLTEDADASASRTWVVDSANDLGSAATKYYASYTNTPYLSNGWPILETAVTDRDFSVYTDQEVAPYATAIGYRLAPPIGIYKITVNGSLDPQVGTYWPGDWCVVVTDDSFLNNRLKPPYENREGILVRKIASMSVSVPDNPAFPEIVDLDLVPEWEVNSV
jgi:hypothetical protein